MVMGWKGGHETPKFILGDPIGSVPYKDWLLPCNFPGVTMLKSRLVVCADCHLWATRRTWLSLSFFRCSLPQYLLWLDFWVLATHLSSQPFQSTKVLNVSWTMACGATPSTPGKVYLQGPPVTPGEWPGNLPQGRHCSCLVTFILQVPGRLWSRSCKVKLHKISPLIILDRHQEK